MEVAEESPCRRYVRSNKILGRGAFKDVYKGFDQIDETEIAWNQICIEDETTLKSPQSVLSEAVLLNSLNHRNIIKCYAFWLDYDNKSINMITELFDSGSLRQYMKKLGSVEEQTIKNWGRQILQGLHYLHTNQPCIVHRDIKCDNIFVDVSSGEIKIGDFGLATAMEQRPLQVLAGTPEFMAPEYYDEEYDEAVDVYSFGMCLMEMATLECPYSECTNPASLRPSVSELLRDPFFASWTANIGLKMIQFFRGYQLCTIPSLCRMLNYPAALVANIGLKISALWTSQFFRGYRLCTIPSLCRMLNYPAALVANIPAALVIHLRQVMFP